MPKRRRNGEGSWGKKTINGYQYHFYIDLFGRYIYGKTEKEVKDKLAKKKLDEEPLHPNSKMLLGEYMIAWLKSIKTKIEPTTYEGYLETINNRIINFRKYYDIADVMLSELSARMFQKYLDTMAEHYAHVTIVNVIRWFIISIKIDV